MIDIKTLNEISVNIINNIHDSLPEVDTKEGTFVREVLIDPISKEFSDIYNNLYKMELAQSILTATGQDLDRLAANYFIQRKNGTGSFGKVRFYVAGTRIETPSTLYSDIRIPKGTMISTKGIASRPSIQFKTCDEIMVKGSSEVIGSGMDKKIIRNGVSGLPKDSTGFRYIEVLCESIDIGTHVNIGPYEIVHVSGTSLDNISSVSNPFSFAGGSNPEDDVSLALRVGLAITGSNIGTKDGYLSYVLQQPQVLDALVVGAGDPYMTRDILTIVDEKTGNHVRQNIGGKVDIYVRTNTKSQDEFSYIVTSEDLNNDFKVPRMIQFPNDVYPIEKVVSVIGQVVEADNSVTYTTYVGADDYEQELKTNGKGGYYIDILWDFSTKTFFPDTMHYPLPDEITEEEIVRLKSKLDSELQIAEKYLNDISYKINWDLIDWVDNEDESEANAHLSTTLFDYGRYNNNLYYKLKMKTNNIDASILGGRVFVKKEGKIYVRAFVIPDYRLVRDDSDYVGSVKSRDYLQWFSPVSGYNNIQIPKVGEKLIIKFINNIGIKELQDGIETKRVLTADVLIKAAKQRNVEIRLYVACSPSYNSDEISLKITQALTFHVNSRKKLGDYIDQSDIVYIVKGIDGVISVDIDSIGLSFTGMTYVQSIKCNPDEFFFLKNLILSVTNNYKN